MPEALGHSPPRLKLKGCEYFTRYASSFLLLVPTITLIYCLATHKYVSSAIPGMRTICLWTLALSAFLAWFQTRALRFRVIETSESARENYQKVMEAIGRTDWRLSQHRVDSQMVAKVPGAASWGERVEVRFHGTCVYVNSICDPTTTANSGSRPADGRREHWRPTLVDLGAGCQRLTLVVAHVSPSGGLRRSC
jgi:hypothetical protein